MLMALRWQEPARPTLDRLLEAEPIPLSFAVICTRVQPPFKFTSPDDPLTPESPPIAESLDGPPEMLIVLALAYP
jgi:hypothetical protein